LEFSGIDVYIGAPIEVASEREVFAALIGELSEARVHAIVFANFNVARRQLDFLVATDSLTLVIEAKSFSRPVRGGVNGSWRMQLPGGATKGVGNPYSQALAAKNALRDALREFGVEQEGYPNACVAITPQIPKGSVLPPNDFKVTITDLQGLSSVLRKPSGFALPLSQWRSFALEIQLRRVATSDEALDGSVMKWSDLLARYRAEFARLHSADARSLQSDTYLLDDDHVDAFQVARRAGVDGDDLLIAGPSGCGKTLLLKMIAIQAMNHGQVPVLLQAKYFTGRFQELVEREASLLGVSRSKDLIRSAMVMGFQLLLIVDGYNECSLDLQLALTRSLAAATRRFDCRLVISTQLSVARPDLLAAVSVNVSRPSDQLKAAISGINYETGGDHLKELLDSVSSGFEADLVGRVGASLAEGASRFALFDAYARQKLGADQFDGVRLLAAVASHLGNRVSFSLSIRELDRLAAAQRVSGEVLARIVAAGMIVRRGDRISFRHELIQCAFVAESLARDSHQEIGKALRLLLEPLHRNSRALILGAYDDDEFVAGILSATADADLVRRAAVGECGIFARSWVRAACAVVLEKLNNEASGLRFSLGAGSWGVAGVSADSALHWAPSELALMPTICNELWGGGHAEAVLTAVGNLDRSLDRAFRELEGEPGIRKSALRDGLFADAYLFGRDVGMVQLFRSISGGRVVLGRRERALPEDFLSEWALAQSPGQIYLMLMLTRFSGGREGALPYILPLMGERWSGLPYHLQLEILNYTHFVIPSGEVARQELVNALDALLPRLNPVLSGMVLEALEGMGALEEQSFAHSEIVKAELQALLTGPVNVESCQHAWVAYLSQFDHPFSSRYCEVISYLSHDDRKRFLGMACMGAGEAGLFLAPAIQKLASFRDHSVAPAIARWLNLPRIESVMPQDAVSAFVWAHSAFGMLGAELPARQLADDSMAGSALASLGDLYYWMHREDLTPDEVEFRSNGALGALLDPRQTCAASALRLVVDSTSYDSDMRESVVRRFPAAVLDICRGCLMRPDQQGGYFPHFKHELDGVVRFSIELLGYGGDGMDLPILRKLSRDSKMGDSAINAIRMIEDRATR